MIHTWFFLIHHNPFRYSYKLTPSKFGAMFLKRNNVTITWRNSYTPRLLTLTFTIEFKSQLKSLKIFCQISLFKNRNLVVINSKVNVPNLYKNFVPIALSSVSFCFLRRKHDFESFTTTFHLNTVKRMKLLKHACMYVCMHIQNICNNLLPHINTNLWKVYYFIF